MLGDIPADNINDSVREKMFSINFSKAKIKFCLSLHYNGNNSCYLFVNGKKNYKFKVGLSPSNFFFFFFICFNDSPSKMMKNALSFILKALFVLKIFNFLS